MFLKILSKNGFVLNKNSIFAYIYKLCASGGRQWVMKHKEKGGKQR